MFWKFVDKTSALSYSQRRYPAGLAVRVKTEGKEPLAMMKSGKFFETAPGISIHYVDKGQGTPIIFVPGWGFSLDAFEKQVEYFSKDYRVICVDPRAHGRSTVTDLGYDHMSHAQDIVNLINYLDLKDIVLVGWSFGAYETWGVIRLIGLDNIKGLFNIDMPPRALVDDETTEWHETTLADFKDAMQSVRNQADFLDFVGGGAPILYTGGYTEDDVLFLRDNTHTPYHIAMATYATGITSDFRPEAQLADACPTCHTEFMIAEHWADLGKPYMEKLCPNTKIHVLGGHLAFYQYHETFNKLFEEFLKKC